MVKLPLLLKNYILKCFNVFSKFQAFEMSSSYPRLNYQLAAFLMLGEKVCCVHLKMIYDFMCFGAVQRESAEFMLIEIGFAIDQLFQIIS